MLSLRRDVVPLVLLLALTGMGGVARIFAAEEPAPAPKDDIVADGDALIAHWTPPVCPPEVVLKKGEPLYVTVRFVVDIHGKVTSERAVHSDNEKLNDAAVAAIKSWTFTPALSDGKPIDCSMETRVEFLIPNHASSIPQFLPPQKLRRVKLTPAEPLSTPAGTYPEALTDRKLPGRVLFSCKVDIQGHVVNPTIVFASHVEFVIPALQALKSWKFSPAHEDVLNVPSDVEGEVEFDAMNFRAPEVLEANAITNGDGSPAADAPAPTIVVDPIWPFESMMKGEEGSATVDFKVSETGFVSDVVVHDASQPEFGKALAAAVSVWRFDRNRKSTESITLRKRFEFKNPASAQGSSGPNPLSDLTAALRGGKVGTAAGLDHPLSPILRVSPAYPDSLKKEDGPAGTTLVEIVIARDGRVYFPHVLSASRDEFGWSAATALSRWVFEPPTRNGAPVDVRVQVPIHFSAR